MIRKSAVVFAAAVAFVTATSAMAGSTSYKYDALGRVIEVDYSDGSSVTYQYDAAGNRTQVTRKAVTVPVVVVPLLGGLVIPLNGS